MNSPGKLTACNSAPKQDWSEDLARLHCLQALFPDWTGQDRFLLHQLKASIEASIKAAGAPTSYETFAAMASALRDTSNPTAACSHGFIRIDFSNRTWDPLFAQYEIVTALKQQAGIGHLFLVIVGLHKAIFPKGLYLTKNRIAATKQSMETIDALAGKWSTPSTSLHLLYL